MDGKRVNLTIPGWIYNKYIKEKGKDPERTRELILKGIMYENEEYKTNNGTSGNCTFLHNPLLAGISGVS